MAERKRKIELKTEVKEAVIMPNADTVLDLTEIEDPQLRLAVNYLVWHDPQFAGSDKINHEQIANKFGITSRQLSNWKSEWVRNGTMSRAMNILVAVKQHELEKTALFVLDSMNDILRNMVRIASNPNGSDKNAIDAFKALESSEFVRAILAGSTPPSDAESSFLETHKGKTFDPNEV